MNDDLQDELKRLITVNIQSYGKTSHSYPIRKLNVEWIENIDRAGLRYKEKEIRILIRSFEDADLYIQLPGKETVKKTKMNALDFRPILLDKKGNKCCEDLKIDNIWESFDKIFEKIGDAHEEERSLLAAMLYRMALMEDHKQMIKGGPITAQYVDIKTKKVNNTEIKVRDRYCYLPDERAIEKVSQVIPEICGMKLETFLCYLESLIWNEDCKYYDRKKAMGDKNNWYTIGRVNTIKTIIIFIGARIGFIPILKVFKEFGRQGIAKPDDSDITRLGGKYIIPNEHKNKKTP